jgi:hypothetical protein
MVAASRAQRCLLPNNFDHFNCFVGRKRASAGLDGLSRSTRLGDGEGLNCAGPPSRRTSARLNGQMMGGDLPERKPQSDEMGVLVRV